MRYEEVQGFKFGFHPIARPKLEAYIYYVDGLLIDTGQSRVRQRLLTEIRDLNIEQIFVTHHHEDHTGNILAIQEQHQCPVYGSSACSELMKNPPKLSLIQQVVWGNRSPHLEISKEDHFIKTKNHTFSIIPIPGHASDMVALYEPEKKWLFSADLYINSYIAYFINNESISQQIESTKRILELDFKVLFCSHNPQLIHPKEQLTKKLNFLESSFDQVATLHLKGYTNKEIFKAMRWKENNFAKILSGGQLSKMNMVRSIVRDLDEK